MSLRISRTACATKAEVDSAVEEYGSVAEIPGMKHGLPARVAPKAKRALELIQQGEPLPEELQELAVKESEVNDNMTPKKKKTEKDKWIAYEEDNGALPDDLIWLYSFSGRKQGPFKKEQLKTHSPPDGHFDGPGEDGLCCTCGCDRSGCDGFEHPNDDDEDEDEEEDVNDFIVDDDEEDA